MFRSHKEAEHVGQCERLRRRTWLDSQHFKSSLLVGINVINRRRDGGQVGFSGQPCPKRPHPWRLRVSSLSSWTTHRCRSEELAQTQLVFLTHYQCGCPASRHLFSRLDAAQPLLGLMQHAAWTDWRHMGDKMSYQIHSTNISVKEDPRPPSCS